MPRALVILAEGFEELEAVTIMDLLVRAGIEVIRAGLTAAPIKASRHTVIVPDIDLSDVADENFDLIALPGGLPGADNLANDERVIKIVQKHVQKHAIVAAICAAPRVLVKAGVTLDKCITCFPGALDALDVGTTQVTGVSVSVDLPLITSRGPGTAIDFTLQLIGSLLGKDARDKVEAGLVRN